MLCFRPLLGLFRVQELDHLRAKMANRSQILASTFRSKPLKYLSCSPGCGRAKMVHRRHLRQKQHIYDSQGKVLALAFRCKPSNSFKYFPRRAEAVPPLRWEWRATPAAKDHHTPPSPFYNESTPRKVLTPSPVSEFQESRTV